MLCIHLKKIESLQTHLLQYSLFMRTLKGKKIIEKKYICVRLLLFFFGQKCVVAPPPKNEDSQLRLWRIQHLNHAGFHCSFSLLYFVILERCASSCFPLQCKRSVFSCFVSTQTKQLIWTQ